MMASASRPGSSGRWSTPQAAARSTRAAASATLRPPGSRFGRAPVSTAPRSPARRGTQPTRAPVARDSASSAENAPGTSASRSPARTTAPGVRNASTAGPPQLPSASARRDRASAPGSVVSTVALSFSAARVANGARSKTGRPRGWCARPPRPQEDDRRLLLGLEPDEDDGRGGAQVVVGDRAGVRAGAGHRGLEERQLLGRVGAGPGVDVVRAECHPGELRPGVGVLDGQPAPGEDPDAALVPGGAQAVGRGGPGLRPGRLVQLAVGTADQRGGEPLVGGDVAERVAALV